MAHIDVGNDFPGIISLLMFDRETAKPITGLAQTILRRPSTLSEGERELIATYVSYLNGCKFCNGSHHACAAILLNDEGIVNDVENKGWAAGPSPKMNGYGFGVRRFFGEFLPMQIKKWTNNA